MANFALTIANYLLFIFMGIVAGGFQSALWYQVFGHFPAPYLWLTVLCYWTLYRSIPEGLIMTYVLTLIVASMSGIPLNVAFLQNLIVFGSIYLLKDRVLWSGPNSFAFASGLAAVLLPICTFVVSAFVEPRPISDFHFFDWLVRPLLTAAFALPFYYLYALLDRVTQKEPPRDTESEVL